MSSMEDHQSEDASPADSFHQLDDEVLDDSLPQCKIKRNYSCNLCSFFSQNPRSFLYHMRDVHFDKIKIYECSQCLYASKHSQKLQRHINMIHAPGKRRAKKVVQKKAVEKKLPIYNSLIPPQEEELIGHPLEMDTNDVGDGEIDVKCSMCNFTSRSVTLMRRHEKVVHMKKKFFRCAKCSYVTHVKARFTKHVKYHSMPMIKCDLCDFRTPYKWNLDRHYRNHCGSGAFQCSKCNFRADIKQSLTVHEMNHHVPPVGAGAAVLMKKRNKVGASETTAFESDGIDQDELELLRLEREDVEGHKIGVYDDAEEPDLNAVPTSKLQSALKRPLSNSKQTGSDSSFAHPSNASLPSRPSQVKTLKCKFCSYKAAFAHEISRHEKRIHGYIRDKRPPPNLIPIQGQGAKSPSPILKIPEVRSKQIQQEEPTPIVDEEEFTKLCKKSSLTSSLKEIVSLIGDEDGLKTIPDTSEDELQNSDSYHIEEGLQHNTQTDMLKRKNASFFDKLKEKLMNGSSQENNLICDLCGYESKCLSESISHENKHIFEKEELMLSGSELSSTRCQHCRQRCKTSSDLINHLKICSAFGAAYGSQKSEQASVEESENATENKVFVWTEFSRDEDDEFVDGDLGDTDVDYDMEPLPECSVELTEGLSPPHISRASSQVTPEVHITSPSMKKVFKCPHCSFWASTASRFHVHIVGHLNKKPFECSLCSYRSNWRWDITKHIRLKSARDPTHVQAVVNMTDETGRRNYSKYNKYLTMMKVSEPTADSSGTGRRTRACEATQGTVTDADILQPIPAPPQLIPAPQPKAITWSHSSVPRPPPPLQPAHPGSISKRTLWKCKKCQYRNSDREKVLAHVKNHYEKKDSETKHNDTSDESELEIGFKSNGILDIGNEAHNDLSSMETSPILSSEEGATIRKAHPFACDICPFIADTDGDLTAHKLNHVDRPGSIFKCTYCPFYVPSKIAVLEHMEIHGGESGVEISSLNFENVDPGECFKGDLDSFKRYSCQQCPYVSNSKTQFLYHKQFHRPRDTAFKCMYCSYNVSRRHLLHQHLRVHHMYKSTDSPMDSESEDSGDVRLVWVNRGGSFLKMYKCRSCPHVSFRKANVTEHEKSHILNCEDCNFTSTNSNTLASHVKMHSSYQEDCITQEVSANVDGEEQNPSLVEPEILIKIEEPDGEMSTPESSYYQSYTVDEEYSSRNESLARLVNFCYKCPARFLNKKELRIHSKFHLIRLPFKCEYCSYTARQRPHLLAHLKVHGQEYQERTAALVDTYMISTDHPPPKTALVTKGSELIKGPVWSVISSEIMSESKVSKPLAKHSCHRCPAKFFKSVALQYHLTLHGGNHQHKCKYCDYTVKTYGNLIKHQLVHENSVVKQIETSPVREIKSEPDEGSRSPSKKPDPQFGTLMHGSPNFIYPTYLKNGKLREKRYKCHKCPSAFEKRDQYSIHLSLHGSKQRYKCEKCDYSVKYYANYVQHMKKHQHNDQARQSLNMDVVDFRRKSPSRADLFSFPATELTMIEKQILYLQHRKKSLFDIDRKYYFCDTCPYYNLRRDCLENHERRHFEISGIRFAFECDYCDYSATQANFLREHVKLHFKPAPRYKPDAFLKADNVEIWCAEECAPIETKVPIFKDCGENAEVRFEPPLSAEDQLRSENTNEKEKIFMDLTTFEPLIEGEEEGEMSALMEEDILSPKVPDQPDETAINEEDLIEMVQVHIEVPKPKVKRLRGKNWRCRKCPHAFGKRDQFLRHIALHGSQQRYSCHICDYSVKFYTNYVQHMRMHQSHEPDRLVHIKQYVASPDGGFLQGDDPPRERATLEGSQIEEIILPSEESSGKRSSSASPHSEETSMVMENIEIKDAS